MRKLPVIVGLAYFGCMFSMQSSADDWPTYQHDQRRTGTTQDELHFPLQEVWVRLSPIPPQTAWTGPAKWDAWAGNEGLQSMRNFDPCFYVTVSGDQVFYGSSVDDAVHALNAETGRESWVHFTGAPVRFPPTLANGLAWFGSDDGCVYCVRQTDGKRIWKRHASPQIRNITSNRKIISLWPVRTGVMLVDDKVVYAGSLVPWEQSWLCKVDAKTGNSEADECFEIPVSQVTLQGALLASPDRIYVPQGRAAPLAFSLSDGKFIGPIGEAGGVFCVLTDDEMLLAGPQNQKSKTDQIRLSDGTSRGRLATFAGSNRIIVQEDSAWLPSNGRLRLLDRKKYVQAEIKIAAARKILSDKKQPTKHRQAKQDLSKAEEEKTAAWSWSVECPAPTGFIKAGNAILVGLKNEVRAYRATDGEQVWAAKVKGIAHGLAVANGRLYVSTGQGHLYAFAKP